MKYIRTLLAAMVVVMLAASVGAQVPVPTSGPLAPAGATSRPTTRQALARLLELNSQLDQLFKAKQYTKCRQVLDQILKLDPQDATAWYNLACVDCRLAETDPAMEHLTKAIDLGYSNLRYMDRDPDLEPLHKLGGFKNLLARDNQIQLQRARKIEQELKRQTGNSYIVEADDTHRIVFATNVSRSTLDEVKQALTAEMTALRNAVFAHGFEQYLTVIIPSEADAAKLSPSIGGFYDRVSHRLVSRQVGMILQHEFAHAVHGADQDARAQQHPVWIAEGFATLCEAAEFKDGKLLPRDNARLAALQQAIRSQRTVKLKDFIKYDEGRYLAQGRVCYAQSRYLMIYLFHKGLLNKWYDTYVGLWAQDPSGGQSLEKVLGKKLPEIEANWHEWALSLRAPPTELDKACLGVQTLPVPEGLRIQNVLENSGAAQAGLKVGDLLLQIDQHRITDPETLISYIALQPVGRLVHVTFRRDGATSTVTVALQAVPWKNPAARKPKTRPAEAPSK